MITVCADGYVTKEPKLEEGDYGKFIELTIRVATPGREVHYISGRFYGRKIRPVEEFIHGGDYITMSGAITNMYPREKEGGEKYIQIYLKDCFYTLPPKIVGEAAFRRSLPASQESSPSELDDFGLEEDNEPEF
jgi:hypothetical protein